MTASWPAALPQDVERDGFSESPPNLLLRTQMDAGPAKVRRRFTAGVRPVTVRILCTRAQVATLDGFFVTTLKGGSLPFSWIHPRTKAAVQFRFAEPPRIEAPKASDLWPVLLSLEILP